MKSDYLTSGLEKLRWIAPTSQSSSESYPTLSWICFLDRKSGEIDPFEFLKKISFSLQN